MPVVVPRLDGKVIIVTGANTGIGKPTATALAGAGAHVFLAGRSHERTRPVIDELAAAGGKVEYLPLDLSSLASVRAAAAQFLERDLPLDILINNAGLAGIRGATAEGFELAFGTNHLGHFLLTQLLLPRLRRSAPSRVVTVASKVHHRARRLAWDAVRRPTSSLTGLPEYAVSKLANVLFTAELARRLGPASAGIATYSLHPGVIASDLWRRVPGALRWMMNAFMLTPEQGAETSLHCATSASVAGDTGLYYDGCEVRKPSRLARDEALARDLWLQSLEWTHLQGDATG